VDAYQPYITGVGFRTISESAAIRVADGHTPGSAGHDTMLKDLRPEVRS
jgi:hypothetical protein